jgi:cytochrome P450
VCYLVYIQIVRAQTASIQPSAKLILTAFSDYQLHKQRDRQRLYAREGGLWWSDQLQRWMVSDPTLIAAVLRSSSFAGHSYDVSAVMDRFGIDLRHLKQLSAQFPLAFEGERHRALRKKFSAEIAVNTALALEAFDEEIMGRAQVLLVAGHRFCAMQDLLAPGTLAAVMRLAGLGIAPVAGLQVIPLLFDDTISLNKRLQINAVIDTLYTAIGDAMPADEKYFRIAIVALSANTLLGSLGESLAQVLGQNRGIALSEISFDRDFPATGLPLIEKRTSADVMIGGREIKEGDRLRLFLDSAGLDPAASTAFSELYFAAGKHKCPGMNFSRKCWKLLASRLARSRLELRLVTARHRKGDNVFNFAETIEVSVHE